MAISSTSKKVSASSSVVVPLSSEPQKLSRAELIAESDRLKRLLETKSNSVESLSINNKAAYERAKKLEQSYLQLNEELSDARDKLDLSASVGRELNHKVDEYRSYNEVLELKVSLRDTEILTLKAKVDSLCHLSCENIELRENLDDALHRLALIEAENSEMQIERDLLNSEVALGIDGVRSKEASTFQGEQTTMFSKSSRTLKNCFQRISGFASVRSVWQKVVEARDRVYENHNQRRLAQNAIRRKKMWEKGRIENPAKNVRSFPSSTFLR